MLSNLIQNVSRNVSRTKWTQINRSLSLCSNENYRNQSQQCGLFISKRNLFTDEVLGVDRFIDHKEKVFQRFGGQKQKFIDRLQEHINEEGSVILSEDLKNLIFLCENNPNEIEFLKNAILRFEKQNESLLYGTFQFGPVVMRLAKHYNNVDLAMLIMDKNYINFFTQLSSITIALNILFDAGRYDDVLKMFDFMIENYKFEIKYPSDSITLFIAACYKINTLESFDRAFHLLRLLKLSTTIIKSRALFCFLNLAINQNHSNIALEIMQQIDVKYNSTIIQSIRLLAFANINRFHDVFDIIRYNLKKDSAKIKNKTLFKDVLDKIEAKVEKSGKQEIIDEFKRLSKNLNESLLIETNSTLDDALSSPIAYIRNRNQQQQTVKNQMAN